MTQLTWWDHMWFFFHQYPGVEGLVGFVLVMFAVWLVSVWCRSAADEHDTSTTDRYPGAGF